MLESVGHADPPHSQAASPLPPRSAPSPLAPNLQGTMKFKGRMSPPSVPPPQHFRMRPLGVSQAGKIQVVTQETPHPALSLRTREEKDPQRGGIQRGGIEAVAFQGFLSTTRPPLFPFYTWLPPGSMSYLLIY